MADQTTSSNEQATDSQRSPGPSGKATLLAGGAFVLLVGLLIGASLWLFAGLTALAAVIVNRFLANLWSRCVVAKRLGGDVEVRQGDQISVGIELHNTSRIPVLWLLAEDVLPPRAILFTPPALEVQGERLQIFMLWPNQKRVIEYKIKCNRRGHYQIGPMVLETGDVMGLFRRFSLGAEPSYVTVLPKIVPLDAYDIASRRPMGEIRMRDNLFEDPTRLRGIRRWQTGDPMRRVHWAATARTGILHSKVYEPSSIAGATVILDMHVDSNPIRHEPVRGDLAVMAAAGIARALHEVSQPVGLVSNGRDAADRIRTQGWVGDYRVRDQAKRQAADAVENDRMRPINLSADRGPGQLQEIRSTLARLERSDALTLPELLIEVEGQLSRETTLLFIVQEATEDDLAAIIGLARQGAAVAVIINTLEVDQYLDLAGPLIAMRIPTYHLTDEQSIRGICQQVNLTAIT